MHIYLTQEHKLQCFNTSCTHFSGNPVGQPACCIFSVVYFHVFSLLAVFYGGIVMGGAFAVKYTGAMVLQVRRHFLPELRHFSACGADCLETPYPS